MDGYDKPMICQSPPQTGYRVILTIFVVLPIFLLLCLAAFALL